MKHSALINWRELSMKLTNNPENIRRNRIPKRLEKTIQELDDLLEYWSNRADAQLYEIEKSKKKVAKNK